MGSEFDEVAKAVAKNMPRRKVLKLFAGGVVAAVGSALIGSGASASGRQDPHCYNINNTTPYVNNTAPVGTGLESNQAGFNGDCREDHSHHDSGNELFGLFPNFEPKLFDLFRRRGNGPFINSSW